VVPRRLVDVVSSAVAVLPVLRRMCRIGLVGDIGDSIHHQRINHHVCVSNYYDYVPSVL